MLRMFIRPSDTELLYNSLIYCSLRTSDLTNRSILSDLAIELC